MSKKFSINAAFADCIENIVQLASGKVPHYILTKELIMSNDNSKEEILSAITQSLSFSIDSICGDDDEEEGFITCMMKRSEAEIQEYKDEQENHKLYSINRLKKWYDLEEKHKTQIEAYLIHKKLDWILEAIKV